MAHKAPATTVSSSARTANGNSAAIPLGDLGQQLAVLVNVTAVSGTSPSMTLSIEWSPDGVTFYKSDPVDTFTAITATTTAVKTFAVKAPFYHLVWTITGTTPSFTFAASHYLVG